jgi:membrane-associated phospholipid phosphatase
VAQTFTGVATELPRVVNIANWWLAGTAAAGAVILWPHDREISRRIASARISEEALDPGEMLGGGLVQVGGALSTYVLGRWLQQPRVALVGADLVQVQVFNAVVTQGLKFAVDRRRPDGGRHSFPSGHTSASFATASVIQRTYGWHYGAPAYAFAAYVGVSRMSENRHYPSDAVVGAALGIIAGRIMTSRRGPARVVPVMTHAGAGLSVRW